jgi:hypothetical protein
VDTPESAVSWMHAPAVRKLETTCVWKADVRWREKPKSLAVFHAIASLTSSFHSPLSITLPFFPLDTDGDDGLADLSHPLVPTTPIRDPRVSSSSHPVLSVIAAGLILLHPGIGGRYLILLRPWQLFLVCNDGVAEVNYRALQFIVST